MQKVCIIVVNDYTIIIPISPHGQEKGAKFLTNAQKKLAAACLSLTVILSACSGSALPADTPPPEEVSTPPLSAAEAALAEMSAEEKVWQLLCVFPEDICGEKCCGDGELWAQALGRRPAGGIVFVSENMPSVDELHCMMNAIDDADAGLFLALDEEGGKVARLSYALGVTTDFKPMYEYREEGRIGAYENAITIAADIASFGFNMDLAPVADVWTNSKNTVIGRRAYSDDPLEAASLVSAAVQGFHAGGVISVLKHFPGHGDTAEDSHFKTAYTDKSLDEMRECEFLPFSAGISAGCEVVMVGHITARGIDPDAPATLSSRVIKDVLRGELGFEGLVITDAFTMAGLGDMPEAEAAVRAIEAGCDMILAPADPDAVVKAIMASVSEERIDESVLRILELKYGWGIIE